MKLTLNKYNTQNLLTTTAWIAVGLFSLYMFSQLLMHKYYYEPNDSYYYYSIANNLHENGLFADGTSNPYKPVITPQNGIVAVFWVLQLFRLSPETIFVFVACLNYILMCISLYPLLKIAELLGLKNSFTKIALAALLVCNLTYLKHQSYPVNDGIFRACSLWLIYFFFICHKKYCSEQIVGHWKLKCTAGFILSIIMVHFRIESLLFVFSFALAALLIRKFRLFAFTSIILAAMALSLASFYAFNDTSMISEYSGSQLGSILNNIFENTYNVIFLAFPTAIYKNLGHRTNLLYAPFYISVLLALYTGYRRKNFEVLSLALIFLSLTGLFISHGVMQNRYFITIIPIVYLLLIIRERLRVIGYLFIFTIVASSAWVLYDGIYTPQRVGFWTYVSRNVELEKDNTFLISLPTRPAWFFTGVRVYSEYTADWGRSYDYPFEKLLQADHVYLAGDATFVEEQKNRVLELAKQNSCKVDFQLLTTGYHDHVGHGLYQIRLTANETSR